LALFVLGSTAQRLLSALQLLILRPQCDTIVTGNQQ